MQLRSSVLAHCSGTRQVPCLQNVVKHHWQPLMIYALQWEAIGFRSGSNKHFMLLLVAMLYMEPTRPSTSVTYLLHCRELQW